MNQVIQIQRDPKPYEGQEKAITILDRNLLVSAGAGSGKTWVLTERYLEILSKGYSPSQIVAITFTEKAAGEMRERIQSAMQKMAVKTPDTKTQEFWEQREQELKYSMITTIHGFCARLLRLHPLEAGLDPEFSVLDGMEAGLLIRDVFLQAIEEFLEEDESALSLYEEFGQTNGILQAVLDLYEVLQTYHKTTGDLLIETRQQMEQQQVLFHQRLNQLHQLVEQMKEEFISIKGEAKKPLKYFSDFEDWMCRFSFVHPKLVDCGGLLEDSLKRDLEDLVKNKWTKSGTDTLKDMTDQLREQLIPVLLDCMIVPTYPNLIENLLRLVDVVKAKYEKEKQQRQVVDFHDLEILTARLLEHHPEVCQKWQRKVQFLMVDEFQDTNSLQKSIVDCLTGHGQMMRLFVVGDGKQSIYRFRGADVQIFYEMEKEILAQNGEKVRLSMNFRTQDGVIGYINSLFASLMKKTPEDPLYYTEYDELEANRQLGKVEPHIEFICSSLEEEDPMEQETELSTEDVHWVEREADLLARRIKQMVEQEEKIVWKKDQEGVEKAVPARYGDVCILLAARSQMHLYEFAFQEYGIPYTVVGGRQFYGKQEVLDVMNLLRLIHDPRDELSLLGFLRSPFVQLSDSTLFWLTREQSLHDGFYFLENKPSNIENNQWESLLTGRHWLNKWVFMSKHDSISHLLQEVMDSSGYPLILLGLPQGEQKWANVQKLMHLAGNLVEQKGYDLHDFLLFLKRMQADAVKEEEASVVEDAADAVTIMSVHASKGLEYPVICVPELRKDVLKKGGPTPSVLYQPGSGIAVRLRDVDKGMPGNGFYHRLAEEEKDRELQEAKRLLYVALTRARDHLVLVGSKTKGKNTWLQWILGHLGWNELEDSLSHHVMEVENWKVRIWQANQLATFPKRSEEDTTTWKRWTEDPKQISSDELPEMPFLQTHYRWETESRQTLPTLSASAFMEYQRCQKSFYVKYVERFFDLASFMSYSDIQLVSDNNHLAASEIGTIVHAWIEKTLSRAGDVDLQEILALLGYSEEELSDKNRRDILRYYQAFQKFMRDKSGRLESEKRLLMLWNGQPIQGTIDLLEHRSDGSVCLIDFKTNRVNKPLEEMVKPYMWQGYLYLLLVESVMKKKVSAMDFVFLDAGDVYHLDVSDAQVKAFRKHMDQTIHGLLLKVNEQEYSSCRDPQCICSWWEESFSTV